MSIFIAGLGVMGAAAARAFARRGARVIGCDAHAPPHAIGSSHGESRIIREAYFEHPDYVPIARRAFMLWRELERESARPLLRVTGGVNIGPAHGTLFRGATTSSNTHGVATELLENAALTSRFPAFRIADDWMTLFEPGAGVLDPEACVAALLQSARVAGAELHFGESLTRWQSSADGVTIETTRTRYAADVLMLATGAWLPQLQPALPLTVTRQPVFWFAPADRDAVSAGRLPIFLIEFERDRFFYGFPDLGTGLKCAIHHEGDVVHPDAVDRDLHIDELTLVQSLLERFIPSGVGPLVRHSVCLYTNTPDGDFLIDRVPDDPRVWLYSPCSGHGFKFAPALAEMLAAGVETGQPPLPRFALSRLSGSARR